MYENRDVCMICDGVVDAFSCPVHMRVVRLSLSATSACTLFKDSKRGIWKSRRRGQVCMMLKVVMCTQICHAIFVVLFLFLGLCSPHVGVRYTHFDGFVVGCREQGAWVRGEGYASHTARMRFDHRWLALAASARMARFAWVSKFWRYTETVWERALHTYMWGAHNRTVRSLEPDAIIPLSFEIATDSTGPCKERHHEPRHCHVQERFFFWKTCRRHIQTSWSEHLMERKVGLKFQTIRSPSSAPDSCTLPCEIRMCA
jgi:hypothetical protein